MSQVPRQIHVYHITHVDNLPGIIAAGGLLSDAALIAAGRPAVAIGMSAIKRARLERRVVKCHPDTMVGQYVPFYFCPRSIMLYLIHRRNHPDLAFREGQAPIVHLVASLREAVDWADREGRRWSFSLSNAGAAYAEFRKQWDDLDQIDWQAVEAVDFSDPVVKEGKQAEFLMFDRLPWELIHTIGVHSRVVYRQVVNSLPKTGHRPTVELRPKWYY